MLEQFLNAATPDLDTDPGAFVLAWRPVGARPLSAALTGPIVVQARVSRPALPSFELLSPA